MLLALRRCALGLILIAAASAVLLLSDRAGRSAGAAAVRNVALFQFASQPILDDGLRGIVDGLAAFGFVDGQTVKLQKFNAEGDIATANTIARQLTGGEFDLVVTETTPCMQVVARANGNAKVPHIFGLVSDPPGSGVGISADNPLSHPPYMAGLGTMQPVPGLFRLVKRMNPALKSVGVAWNPAESNSEACTKLARAVCKELGITLLEATVEKSTDVAQAAGSLTARGVQAIWVGGDTTVAVGIDALISTATKSGVPVFTNLPGKPDRGSMLDLGADYYQVGRLTGSLAGMVLRGLSPATVPVKNMMPEQLMVNRKVLAAIGGGWHAPPDVLAKATTVVDPSGAVKNRAVEQIDLATTLGIHPPVTKHWKLHAVQFVNVPDCEEATEGFRQGLKQAGLNAGSDYEMTVQNAQGDMATLQSLIDAGLTKQADMIVTFSTPTLQAALARAKDTPVVFSYVADPFVAGAGKTPDDHKPTVTGVYTQSNPIESLKVLRKVLPSARTVGTLFAPSEVNSVFHKEKFEKACASLGLTAVCVGVNSSTEVSDAAQALCSRHIDAICQIPGNLTTAAFASTSQAAKQAHVPLFGTQLTHVIEGAILAVSRDYTESGRETGLLAAQIMRGADPAKIPLQSAEKDSLLINPEAAKAQGVTIPADIVKRADRVIKK
jgi:ABC-type uncharacterized transport system substrate-binding protein